MNRNDKHDPALDDEDDGESHAADEPTAVWDESALRAAGLTDLLNKRKSDPPPPPATQSAAPDRPSIEVSQEMAQPQPEPEAPIVMEPAPPSGGLGWSATLALAIVLGGVVYALIRHFKG
ncbi:MAG TPA: hypothetical protein VFX59_06960 [Polyangiales bacterium]|nr:hypothetical protein [Polyangiales bacterium]